MIERRRRILASPSKCPDIRDPFKFKVTGWYHTRRYLFALSPRVRNMVITVSGRLVEYSYQYLIIGPNLLNHDSFSLGAMPPLTPTIRRPAKSTPGVWDQSA